MAAVTSTVAAGLVIIGGVAAGVGKVKSGLEASKRGKGDMLAAANAAEEIRTEQNKLQSRETKNAQSGQLSQLQRATEEIKLGAKSMNSSANDSLFSNFVEGQQLEAGSGFAGSGQIKNIQADASSGIRRKVGEEMESLENRSGGLKEDFSFGMENISIADARSRADVEQRFQDRISEIGSVADTFMEGVFGSDNEIEGYNYG